MKLKFKLKQKITRKSHVLCQKASLNQALPELEIFRADHFSLNCENSHHHSKAEYS
jgi:hypothetical protein